MISQMLEAFMLVCFGCSWPLSLMKNIKARSAKNMSLSFTLLIIAGYVAGITAKFLNGQFNYVLAFYFLNLLMVALNIPVYVVNRRIDEGKEIRFFRHLHQLVYYDMLWVYNKFGRLTEATEIAPVTKREVREEWRQNMNPMISELSQKVQDLKKLATELDDDYLKATSSEESLLIQGVVRSLEEAEGNIRRAIAIEEAQDKGKAAS